MKMKRNEVNDDELQRLIEAGAIVCDYCGEKIDNDIEAILGHHEKCWDEQNTYRDDPYDYFEMFFEYKNEEAF